MPRLNVEDSWWTDPRRYKLSELVGSEAEADGLVLAAWRMSQLFWGNGRKKIPHQEFAKLPKHDLLFQAELASKHGGFVYVRGTKQFHEWYASLKDSASKGGRSKTKSTKRIASDSQADSKSLTLPLTLPLTLTLNKELKTKNENEERPSVEGDKALPQSPSARFIGEYVKAYKKKYGPKARPSLDGKTLGGIKRLLETTNIDRACQLIQVYCQMDDPWFKTKAHDFATFEQNLTKVGLALDTGQKRGGLAQWELEILEQEKKNELPRISDSTRTPG